MTTKAKLLATSPTEYLWDVHAYEGCNIYCQDGVHATVIYWNIADRPDLVRQRFEYDHTGVEVVEARPAPEAMVYEVGYPGRNSVGETQRFTTEFSHAYLILFRDASGEGL